MENERADDQAKGYQQFLASFQPKDDKELEQFLASTRPTDRFEHSFPDTAANRERVPEGRRPCPICSQPMETQTRYEAAVDVCSAHGIWLNGNEVAEFLHGYSKDSPANQSQRKYQYERGFRDGLGAAGSG